MVIPRRLDIATILMLIVLVMTVSGPVLATDHPEIGTSTPEKITYFPALTVLAGTRHFNNSDLHATYGHVFGVSARLVMENQYHTRFLFGAGYERGDGDPFYDIPDYSCGSPNRLHIVPLETGVMADLARGETFRFYIGAVLQTIWLREEYPGLSENGRQTTAVSGWDVGVRVPLAAEWRFADLQRAVGFEFSVGRSSFELDDRGRDHFVVLDGFEIQVYYSNNL